jgi:hypothetical protein
MKQVLLKILPFFFVLLFLFLISATIYKYREDIRVYLLDNIVSKDTSSGELVLRPCAVREIHFKNLKELPKHWRYFRIEDAPGMKAGHFESTEKDFKVYYRETTANQVNKLRFEETTIGWYQVFSFENNIIQCYRIKKTVFITIISKEIFYKNAVKYYKSVLCGKPLSNTEVPGMAGIDFYSTVKEEEDIAYVIELVARHWKEIVNSRLKADKDV